MSACFAPYEDIWTGHGQGRFGPTYIPLNNKFLAGWGTLQHYASMSKMRNGEFPQSTGCDDASEDWFERVALGASFLCIAHCLALPLVFLALPALSRLVPIPESFHLLMLVVAIPSSAAALFMGRSHHGRSWPIVAGMIGLTLLTIAALFYEGTRWDVPISVFGSVALIAAHAGNWRLRHAGHRH